MLNAAQLFSGILIERRAALLFIDGLQLDWRKLALTCKSNAATRRIPICLVSDDGETCADAILNGVDLAISWAQLESKLDELVGDLARAPDEAVMSQLACECNEALPPLAQEGVELFNRGEYYRQHDCFEELWMATAGPVRDLYRAILQVGVAYYQIEGGNYRGALKMLQRSVQWLHLLPDTCQGIDVAKLRGDSYAVRSELQRLGPNRLDEFDRARIKKLRWKAPHSPST
ncbi:MAG: DUF309 domain-containing protein [Chloroflexi bacterium]|nr:DUF309 domain-containing protein [Chloroflexota bacterium]